MFLARPSSVSLRSCLTSAVAAGVLLALAPGAGLSDAAAQTQLLPGRNVNMVSGTQWPMGDPYLQRQNEPSVAASTRNPLHLLAGANDYRTVDVPFVEGAEETGDAWLGLFMSFDGGQRWQSTLLPGYPQDTSPEGLASPLKGYQAGADPVVRAGTNGLFYYAGLVFDRVEGGKNAIVVSRFIDNNNQEATFRETGFEARNNPVKYLGATVVAQSDGEVFLDKPWMAVDIPRPGARTCTIETNDASGSTRQQIRAGRVYVAYTAFTQDALGQKSQIYLTYSDNCGRTFQPAVRISNEADRLNQGATIAIDPRTGVVYVAWRRFSAIAADTGDGFLMVKSTDLGRRFTRPAMCWSLFRGRGKKLGLDYAKYFEHRVKKRAKGGSDADDRRPGRGRPGRPPVKPPTSIGVETNEFDQATSTDLLAFRTNMYPTMTVDGSGRIYLAWSERGYGDVRNSDTDGDARIVMTTSTNGQSWTTPAAIANEGQAGHQIMPSLTFGGGRLLMVYYDLRDDVSNNFGPWIDDKSAFDANTPRVRRTLDLRASWGAPGAAPAFDPSIRVSDYLFSFAENDQTRQLQYNAPNLPMFAKGTSPFMGDYVDVAVAPVFVPTAGGGWTYNLNGSKPVFHAVWTDNRDVRAPLHDADGDGNPWNDYKAPTARSQRITSQFDPTQQLPVCDPLDGLNTGSRNQNIYTARLTTGLIVGSPGNSKPLGSAFQRAFVVFAQNTTNLTKRFRLTIRNQPVGGRASFDQFNPAVTSIDVTTPYRSTASRTVYITSSNPDATVSVSVDEIASIGATGLLPGGLSDVIVLNPDIANPDIANPDIANPDIANPDIANPDIANPDIANPDIANPDIANPDIANTGITNIAIANPDIANPDIANPDIANPDIANPDIANPDIANPDIANPDIANSSLTDVTWTMTNKGNTTASFNVNLFLAQQTDKLCQAGQNPDLAGCIAAQLILRKVYTTPAAVDCYLRVETRNVVVANIRNPRFVTPGLSVSEPNDPSAENATLWLAPGETGKITLRVYDPFRTDNIAPPDDRPETKTDPDRYIIDPLFLPTTTTALGLVTPVVQQQSVDTADVQRAAATPNAAPPDPPLVTPLSPPVPSGQTGDPAPTPVTLSYVAGAGPSNTNVGVAMSPAVQVQVRDQYGALMQGAAVTLFLATNPGNASLGFAGSTATTDGLGVATFPNVTVSAAGVGFTIAATSGTALPAVSAPFTVSSGVTCDSLLVTTTADTNACGSLRFAIATANGSAGTVRFVVAEPVPHVFAPATPLPAVASGVVIDGTTDPDYALSGGQPVIQISGANMPAGSIGLALSGTGSTVRGIEFNGFAAGPGAYTAAGVWLGGTGNHTVQASHFGMLGPNYTGIEVTSSNNVIGGTAPGAGNVFGGQVLVEGAPVTQDQAIWVNSGTGNRIEGNLIGTNGETALGNTVGVRITGGTNTVVGGATVGARNVISGNTTGVLVVGTTGTEVRGNFIGTSADGQSAVANTSNGITMYHGTTDAVIRGNLISGNGGWGVDLQHSGGLGQVTGTDIFGNTIGLALNGQALGNGLGGVRIQNAPDTIVGAPPAAEGEPSRGNVISGNGGIAGHGILVLGAGTGVLIQANRIGTDPAGNVARPNGPIGGDNAAVMIAHNVSGVQIGGDATAGEGNLIGTNAAGTAALPNAKFGIHVEVGPNNVIGGTGPGYRNVISGNGLSGIALTGQGAYAGATGTQVTGNDIGLNATGTGTIPNAGAGVDVREGAAGIITGNTISGNVGAGVAVWQGATGTTISGNSIFDNGGYGIDNDPLNAPTGAPVLNNVTTAGFDYVIPSGAGTIEVFTSPACDPSGYGEGRTLFETFAGAANGTRAATLTAGSYVTITATSGAGTTEFSNCARARTTPTVTWGNPAPITYGTALSATQLNATASVAGTFVYAPLAGTVLSVGTHSLSVSFTPTDATNYTTATGTVSLTVIQATPTVTWGNKAIAVGTPLGPSELNAVASVPGTFVYTPLAGTVLPVGTHSLSMTFTPTDGVNYAPLSGSVTLTVVGPAPGHVLVPAVAGGTANTNCQPSCAEFTAGVGGIAPVNAGVVLPLGSSITLSATGQVIVGGADNGPHGPAGSSNINWPNHLFLDPSLRQFSLLARIGTGPWQYVGPGPTTLTAAVAGELQLAVNDSQYSDNSGWFDVTLGTPTIFVPGTAGGVERAAAGHPCWSCVWWVGPGGTAAVDSGTVLAPGEVVTVSASGLVVYGGGYSAGPDGVGSGQDQNLVRADSWAAPAIALFARVGGGGWQFVGSGPTQIGGPGQSGMLQFAVNDNYYADNSGGWNVTVTRPGLPTATVTPVAPFSVVHNGAPQSLAFTTSPGGLGLDVRYDGGGAPSAVGAYFVRAKVVGGVRAGAGTAILTIGSTLAAGGGGGGPYERYCGSGVFANGFGVSPPNDSLWNAKLLCSDGNNPANFGNTDTPPFNTADTLLPCPAGQVMVGFRAVHGAVWGGGDMMIAVAPRCQLPSGGAITEPFAPAPGSPSGWSQTDVLDCPAGQAVTGVVGGAGSIVDSAALVCSPLPATITSVSPAAVSPYQTVTIRGTNLTGSNVIFTVGGVDYPKDYVWVANATTVVARLPGNIPLGAATVRLDGPTVSNSASLTVQGTVGTPMNEEVWSGSCTTTGINPTPVTAVTAGQPISVSADGTDSYVAYFRWTPVSGPDVGAPAQEFTQITTCGGFQGRLPLSTVAPTYQAGTVVRLQVRQVVAAAYPGSGYSSGVLITIQ